jgi:hypothetical protein
MDNGAFNYVIRPIYGKLLSIISDEPIYPIENFSRQ